MSKSRAPVHSLPRSDFKETDADVPSRPTAAPNVAALVGSEQSGKNTQRTEVMSTVDELAKKIMIEVGRIANEEARRAADLEAVRYHPRAIVAEAERQAERILKNAVSRAHEVIKAVRMTTDRVTDELRSALTNINNLLPASNGPADGSSDKLMVGNGHVTVPASVSAIGKPSQPMKESADYAEHGKEGPAEPPLQTIEAESVPAGDKRLVDAAKLTGQGPTTSRAREVAHFHETEAGEFGRWALKRQSWWRDIFWSYSRDLSNRDRRTSPPDVAP